MVVLLVLAVFSGLRVANGLSIGSRPDSGLSNSQYSAMIADAMVAQTTDLVDSAGPVSSATLTWSDGMQVSTTRTTPWSMGKSDASMTV